MAHRNKIHSKEIKSFAKEMGADLIGIASPDRFDGAPKEMDPRSIFPELQSVIVLGFRIPRGCFRGIEEGTYFVGYPYMGYAYINFVQAPSVLWKISTFLEERGYEGVPIVNPYLSSSIDMVTGERINPDEMNYENSNENISPMIHFWAQRRLLGRSVAPGKPAPDVMIHFRLAAVAAGLGEIGYSKLFLSPEFGPRQRLALILTDAPFEADPLFEGKICDRCMLCVKDCSAQAISENETIKITLANKRLEWGKLDARRCQLAYTGGIPESSPFTPKDYDIDRELERPHEGLMKIPYNRVAMDHFHHLGAIEGARGCIRACMIHLEETGRIKAKFHNPFRKRKPWRL